MDEKSTEIAPLPFVVKLGEILSKENIENVTRELGPDFVIKIPTEESKAAGRDSFEYLKQTRDNYLLLRKYVPDFVPETFFLRATDKEGKPTNYIVQKRLKGEIKPLHEVSDEELNDPEITEQLLRFINGVIAMDEATGKIPDMFGRPIDPLSPRFYNPRYADNLCLIENEFGGKEIYLTDIGATTEQAEKKDLHHRVSMKLVRRNLKRFKRRLEKIESERKGSREESKTETSEIDDLTYTYSGFVGRLIRRGSQSRQDRVERERREVLSKIEDLMPRKEFWLSTELGLFKDMTLEERAEVAVCYTELGPKVASIFQSEEFQGIVTDPKVREMFLSDSFLTPLVSSTESLIFKDMKYEELQETFRILKTSMERFVRGWENPEYTFEQTKPLNFSNFERHWRYHEELEQLISRLPRQLTAGAHTVQFHDIIPPEFVQAPFAITPTATYHGGVVEFLPQSHEEYRETYFIFLHEVVGHGNDITAGVYPVLPLRKHLEYFDKWTKLIKEDPTVLTMNVYKTHGILRRTREDWADSLAWFLGSPKAFRRASLKRYEFFKGYVTEVAPDFDEFQNAKEVFEILEKIEPRTIIGKVKKALRERRKK